MSIENGPVINVAQFASAAANRPAPSREEVVAGLLDLMRKQTGQSGETWTDATTIEEAGLESFDFVEMIFEVEEKYSIDLNFNANTAETVKTVGDVAALVLHQVAKGARK